MKEFRVLFECGIKTSWLDASKWTLEEVMQFEGFGNYQIEYR